MQVMEEVHRVLAPGGVVRVVVPDAAVWLRGYVNQDPRFFATVRREWPFWNWDALDTLAPGEGGGAGGGLDYILPYLGASSLNGHLSGDHQVISVIHRVSKHRHHDTDLKAISSGSTRRLCGPCWCRRYLIYALACVRVRLRACACVCAVTSTQTLTHVRAKAKGAVVHAGPEAGGECGTSLP